MKGLRGHSKPKALMFLFATPERENKGTSSSSPCVMPWLLEAWHVTPGCQAPNRMGEHPMEGMPSGKKPCLTAGGRSASCLCSMWRISLDTQKNNKQQVIELPFSAAARGDFAGSAWPLPEPSLQHQEKCMKTLGSPGV